jgi:hypothetical protein
MSTDVGIDDTTIQVATNGYPHFDMKQKQKHKAAVLKKVALALRGLLPKMV